MARDNPFAKLDIASISTDKSPVKPGYAMTGAAKTVVRSIEDLAENTKKLMEGEVVVELDPRLLDVSFVADRLSDEGKEYQELKQAIKELVGNWFENREATSLERPAMVPFGVDDILLQYREWTF